MTGQNELGLTAGAGSSNLYSGNFKSYFRPSGNFAFYHRLHLTPVLFIGSNVSVMQIEGKQKLHEMFSCVNGPVPDEYFSFSHTTYVGFSFTAGLSVNKFTADIEAGIFEVIYSYAHEEGREVCPDSPYELPGNQTYYHIFKGQTDIGVKFSLGYKISKRVELTAGYFQGVEEQYAGCWECISGNNKQINIGIMFSLLKN